MAKCPFCGYGWSWRLADGRRKCRKCGTRYTCRSLWASSWLSDATKRKLVEMFVLGVPGNRMCFRKIASAEAIERFFRQIRACCALAEGFREPFEGQIECDESTFGGARHGKIQAFPINRRQGAEVIRLVAEHTRPGSLYYTDDWHAYASLAIRGGHIVVRKEGESPKGGTTSTASRAFGVMRNTGFIRTVECPKSFSIFTWQKSAFVSIIDMKTYTPYSLICYRNTSIPNSYHLSPI